ncbi:transglutaminase domain-containing protein [Psychroserpens algicola]|uniref:transglutaminase domain-containing protein n=1 Tax=Psychroserpens algicola TaxID=1719034 RepID=UPI0019548D69|nr:transglutaminase domain-containing protein [Psychroserpens algicola]
MTLIRYIALFIIAFQSNAQISDFDHIDFRKADSIALACKSEGLDNLPQLSYKLTSNLHTDVERFRAIYMWVCTNLTNDYGLYAKNMKNRDKYRNDSLSLQAWNDEVTKDIFRKLVKHKKTICTGYAYILKELSKLADIQCEIIHGYGRTSTINVAKLHAPNHSWNAVMLNNKWYLCDPTWASGLENPVSDSLKYEYIKGFFLVNPKFFAVNHYPIDQNWTLLGDQAPSFESFMEAPIIYGKAYRNLTMHSTPKKFHNFINRYQTVRFQYQLQKSVTQQHIRLEIDDGFNSKKIRPEIISTHDQSLTFDYTFNYDGFYDVHLFIGDDLVSTYTFKVKS